MANHEYAMFLVIMITKNDMFLVISRGIGIAYICGKRARQLKKLQ